MDFAHAGIPEPPPWKRDADYTPPSPGYLRITGFVSKPELQKLNRNSIYVFVNQRLIRDKLILHALSDAYRNIIPPTSFPVVLLFLEMPPQEVDVNVHPAKTEVRFRQPSFVHDFVRDTVRTTLMQARPAASFATALTGGPSNAASSLLLDVSPLPGIDHPVFGPALAPTTFPQSENDPTAEDTEPYSISPPIAIPESPGRLTFTDTIPVGYPDPHADTYTRRDTTTHRGQPTRSRHAACPLNSETVRPAPRLLYPRHQRRRPLDHRPARSPRARPLRKNPPRAQHGTSPTPAPAHAAPDRSTPRPDDHLRRDRRRARAQRLRS